MIRLVDRYLPQPKILNPYPKDRFAPDSRSSRADSVKVIESLDSGIVRVLDPLAMPDVADDTLVIFFCDHGGMGLSRNSSLSHGFNGTKHRFAQLPLKRFISFTDVVITAIDTVRD